MPFENNVDSYEKMHCVTQIMISSPHLYPLNFELLKCICQKEKHEEIAQMIVEATLRLTAETSDNLRFAMCKAIANSDDPAKMAEAIVVIATEKEWGESHTVKPADISTLAKSLSFAVSIEVEKCVKTHEFLIDIFPSHFPLKLSVPKAYALIEYFSNNPRSAFDSLTLALILSDKLNRHDESSHRWQPQYKRAVQVLLEEPKKIDDLLPGNILKNTVKPVIQSLAWHINTTAPQGERVPNYLVAPHPSHVPVYGSDHFRLGWLADGGRFKTAKYQNEYDKHFGMTRVAPSHLHF